MTTDDDDNDKDSHGESNNFGTAQNSVAEIFAFEIFGINLFENWNILHYQTSVTRGSRVQIFSITSSSVENSNIISELTQWSIAKNSK